MVAEAICEETGQQATAGVAEISSVLLPTSAATLYAHFELTSVFTGRAQ